MGEWETGGRKVEEYRTMEGGVYKGAGENDKLYQLCMGYCLTSTS